MTYPYNDEHMYYDELFNQYILTPKAVLDRIGVDLMQEMEGMGAEYPELNVKAFLEDVSTACYTYIHGFTRQTKRQDAVIAQTQEGRNLIFRAMIEQVRYMAANGNLLFNIKKEERELFLYVPAKTVLESELECLGGRSLCYAGSWL